MAPRTRLAERLVRLLARFAADPQLRVSGVDLLTAAERDLVTNRWNDTTRDVPTLPLPELFAAQAARTPNATAVTYADESWTYAELDARSNQLARYLIGLGAAPERLVAVALPRSLDMVAAVLAVVKAGAAYLPIDPSYPTDRIAYMLTDAAPVATLTTRHTGADLPAHDTQVHLDDPDLAAAIAQLDDGGIHDAERLAPLRIAHPAYTIYTSGSTGRPKGVVVSHQGLREPVRVPGAYSWTWAPGSRMAQLISLSFDMALREILTALTAGATLVLPEPGPLAGEVLADVLRELRVTHAVISPSALAGARPEQLPELECLIVGGEACPPELAAAWAKDRRMFNAYGPTEATVCTTVSGPLSGQGTSR